MFFNYISAATIPLFFNLKLATFNLKLATCNFQQAIRSNDAKYVHPPRMATRKIKDFSERRNGRSAKSRQVGISSA